MASKGSVSFYYFYNYFTIIATTLRNVLAHFPLLFDSNLQEISICRYVVEVYLDYTQQLYC